jgi:hypothetical protein
MCYFTVISVTTVIPKVRIFELTCVWLVRCRRKSVSFPLYDYLIDSRGHLHRLRAEHTNVNNFEADGG